MNAKLTPLDLDVENRKYAERMARVFTGNSSWHYVADFSNVTIEANGKRVPKYEDVKGAPSVAEFLTHLQSKRGGSKGLLVIPITKAGACRWGKIDIDVYGGDRMELARKYAKLIKRLGLPLVVELSKSGGLHLAHYSPYTESATDMRAKLADWAAALHCKTNVEIFPKQERLLDGESGSGINLPYFGGDSDATVNFAVGPEGDRMSVDRWLTIIEHMPANASHTPGEVDVEGAADLLSKHWTDGQRDNLNIAVAGTLLRAGLEPSVVQEILDGSSDIVVDDGKHKTAETIARDLDNNKRVPGFPKLAEIMGKEDAREFVRLAGGEPPKKRLPFNFDPTPRIWRSEAPPIQTYTIEPLLPSGVVGILVAEGGAGKTTFAMRAGMSVAGGRDLFGLTTRQGRVVYIACEEHESGLRRRLYWIAKREVERMMLEKASLEAIDAFQAALDTNLIIKSAVGYEVFLIESAKGGPAQGAIVDELIEDLPRPLELLILDPISRLNNAEENSNQVGTMLINAAERLAREVQTAVLLCHHTGKAAAKDRDTGLYAARGASGFVDAARSSIRLLQADQNDVKGFTNVPDGVIAAGDLVHVIHNKSNEGPKAKPFWLRRQALDFERFEPILASGAAQHQQLLSVFFNWFVTQKRAGFSKNRIITARTEVFAPHTVSRDEARALLDRAIDAGDIVEAEKNKQCDTKLLVFRGNFDVEM
jgi:RecA-family ATPase